MALRSIVAIAGLLFAAAAAPSAAAAPYTPTSDDAIVHRLGAIVSPQERQRRAAAQRGNGNDTDLATALASANRAVRRARTSGDPRELGAAQAVLAPWWSKPEPPPEVRLLRATIAQSRHRFDDALKDLNVLVTGAGDIDPALRQQALLTRAAVHQVQGRLDKVKLDCMSLLASAARERAGDQDTSRLYAQACLAEVQSLQGAPREAADAMSRLQARSSQDPWLALLRAEMAQRAGDGAAADKYFQVATVEATDVYSISAHADWLIERGRHAQALTLLQASTGEADAVILRRAIALKLSGSEDAAAVASTLRERLAAARERGTSLHEREEARLALDVDEQPQEALRLARLNWQVQKEPADALLLVRAAVAADQRAEAQALVKALQATGWHDVRLTQALGLGSGRKR